MLISTIKEFRFYVPSCSFDEITSFQAQLDSSEKDILKDKLGDALYSRLCEYYVSITPEDFYLNITNGEYSNDPWKVLLLYSQRIIASDAESRNLPKQAISVNGMGVNVASSSDFDAASDKQIDKGVQSYKNDAMRDVNILLKTLEEWAKRDTDNADIKEIVELWKQSKYYYFFHGLIFPSCDSLYPYLYHMDNRYKFICLLPDIRFIQDEYIAEMVGSDTLTKLLSDETKDKKLLDKLRKLAAAYLVERTSVLAFDKQTRATAHNDSVLLRDSIQRMLKQREDDEKKLQQNDAPSDDSLPGGTAPSEQGYKNNEPGSKIFVSPLLY